MNAPQASFTRTNDFGLQRWVRNDDSAVVVRHYPKINRVRPGIFYVYRSHKRVGEVYGGSLREALKLAAAA